MVSPVPRCVLAREVLARIGDLALDDRGGHRGRAAQVDERVAVAHAALEVAVGRRDDVLAVARHAVVRAHARSAARGDERRAGLDERLDVAGLDRVEQDLPRSRRDDEAHVGVDRAALEDARGDREVLEAAVRAGAENALGDRRALDLLDRARRCPPRAAWRSAARSRSRRTSSSFA